MMYPAAAGLSAGSGSPPSSGSCSTKSIRQNPRKRRSSAVMPAFGGSFSQMMWSWTPDVPAGGFSVSRLPENS